MVSPDQKVAITEQTQFKSHTKLSLLNQQSWLSHVVFHSWCSFSLRCNPFFEIWICKWLSERSFKHPAKKHQRAGSSKTKHFRKPSHSLTKENCFSLFRSRRHFGEWIKRSEALILSQEELCVSKEVKENVSLSRTIHDLSIWNKPLIDTCQYCSTSRANEALRSLANSRGLSASVSFLPPSLPPLSFFRSRFISRAAKTENPVFLCSETQRKRLLRRLTAKKNYLGFATPRNVLKLFFWDKIGHVKSVSFRLSRLLDEVRLSGKLVEISRDYFEFFDLFEKEIIIIIWAWNDCATATQGGL